MLNSNEGTLDEPTKIHLIPYTEEDLKDYMVLYDPLSPKAGFTLSKENPNSPELEPQVLYAVIAALMRNHDPDSFWIPRRAANGYHHQQWVLHNPTELLVAVDSLQCVRTTSSGLAKKSIVRFHIYPSNPRYYYRRIRK